jgi:hypothetical protein
MAGRLQGDKSGNILVEFDYQNIVVVDPNKTIDTLGNIEERLVDHENLVMYANLEAEVVPRTKLSIGGAPNDNIRTISVAKINFLRPTEETFLTTGYYDELTGKNSRNGLGDNQIQEEIIRPPNGQNPYLKTSVASPGGKSTDNGLLGITSINIKTNTSFVPTVSMTLEDVQGRALFQLGDSSPYSAFFNLPYCPFYLTLKGYYGQAVRYQLNLRTFNARFNTFSGNYSIELDFVGYKFNILNEISMGSLFATPHMYSKTFDISKSPTSPEGGSNKNIESQSKSNVVSKESSISTSNAVTQLVSEKGYQKIIEVYSEYKSKGLISPDFPELTLAQLMNKLQTFEQTIQNSYPPVLIEPLTNIRTYKETLTNYFKRIYSDNQSWFNKYMNPKPIKLKGTGEEVYIFKQEYAKNPTIKQEANTLLEGLVTEFNKLLESNPTLGKGSTTPIKNSITYDTFKKQISISEVDLIQTTISQTGIFLPTQANITATEKLINEQNGPILEKSSSDTRGQTNNPDIVLPPVYVFSEFQKLLSKMETESNKKLLGYETEITADLAKKIESSSIGLGFKPTVRNIISVIMASAEGFIRLLDEVHTNAWNVKYHPVRANVILNNPSSALGVDNVQHFNISQQAKNQNQGLVNGQEPIYPWPQFFVETPDDKKGRFQLKYPGDPKYVDLTNGWLYEVWPEVEFVEEYMKGLTQKFSQPVTQPSIDSQNTTNIINFSAIEYPSEGIAYVNKVELKFFYEIWERQFLTSYYSNFVRGNSNQIDQLSKLILNAETNNIRTSLGISSPFLTLKLKNYDITSQNYPGFLANISNQGTGRAYQDFIRDFFVTPYIKALTENSFSILSLNDLGREPQTQTISDGLLQLVKNVTNEPIIIDTYPFTDPTWVSNNMANNASSSKNSVYNTTKVLTVFEDRDVISNFDNIYNYSTNRPVTNFSYLRVSNPTNEVATIGLSAFYDLRKDPTFFVPTEGYVNYFSPNNSKSVETTTSLLNTPYFVNAIQNGVSQWRRNDPHPYTQAAYFFINSLPLASLKEKYKTLDASGDLDYIASCFKKFGAIHKMPYAWVLKLGSIWYRYKTYKTTNVDILDSAWKNFDYKGNFDPIVSSDTKTYTINYDGVKKITLQNTSNNNVQIQVGFYPKVINDFNVFYNGYSLYQNYTDSEIQKSIDYGVQIFNFNDSNIQASSGNTYPYQNIETWSVIVPNGLGDDTSTGAECNPSNNTSNLKYYIIPSFGTQFNQTRIECLNNNQPICEFANNNSIYNGSIRTLWASPNYGYFNNEQIVKPQPDSYLNKIETGTTQQSPFKLLITDEYSKIEEIFSVFDKSILDKFEKEFLNWSKPIANIDLGPEVNVPVGQSPSDPNILFKNFQYLFRNLMEVDSKTSSITTEEYFNNIGGTQLAIFSTTIKAFLEYDVILKYGNPSQYNRRVTDSYLAQGGGNNPIVSPIIFNPYIKNSLPSKSNTTTIAASKSTYPDAWLALETEVGFSTITNLRYSDSGSYITDFFIDNDIEFTVNNVKLLSPIIKMYATQKLLQPTINSTQFKVKLQDYLTKNSNFQDNILNLILTQVRKDLPNQQELPEKTIKSVIDGEQSKIENWETFKSLNDKWIAGSDYTNKTLFEDFLFLDRASRNIGDTIILDIFDLKDILSENSLNMQMSVFTFISGILITNKFNVMPLPSYVNFYNVQDVSGVVTPSGEGSLEFGDRMWGTYLDVDYTNSSPKMVCFFVGKPSEHLDLPKGNSRFRSDAFELRRYSDNPLIEDINNKKDWGVSNKCVGFNVDAGIRNQNVFYSIQVSMDAGKATSESIQAQINMVDQASGRNVTTQNNGLFNFYKNRSYQCTVQCLGNALLQPTMYFNLRNIPMFYGPYFITEVNHTITQGNFETTFTGTRQSVYNLPSIDNYLQSINQNLLTNVESLIKNSKDNITGKAITDVDSSKFITQSGNNTKANPNSCTSNLATNFVSWGDAQSSVLTSLTPEQFVNEIKKETNNEFLQVIIYMICYVKTFESGKFNGYNNNFANITLTTNNYGQSEGFFSPKKYSCLNISNLTPEKTSQPIAAFDTITKFLQFMISRLTPNIDRFTDKFLEYGITNYYVCEWPVPTGVSQEYFNNNLSEYKELNATFDKAFKSIPDAKLAVNISKELNKTNKNQLKSIENTNKGITNPPNNLNTTSVPVTCPPPTINTFSPLTGISGTILTIVGDNLDQVTAVTINNVTTTNNITIINKFNISVIVPFSNTLIPQQNPIIVKGLKGDGISLSAFTYNPAQVTPVPSNPTNTNTQPQQTGPVTLNGQTQTSPGGVTQQLTVSVNPQAAALNTWVLEQNVAMIISVYDNSVVNNTTTQTLNRTVTTTVSNYVSGNVFTMTYNNVNDMLVNNPIPQFKTTPITEGQTVNIKFTVTAVPVNKVKNPQNISQTFNFAFTPISSTTQTKPGALFKVSETYGETLPNFNGGDYYNIKKPTGGYITYQFTCNGLISKGGADVYSIPSLNKQNIIITNNADTKYANIIELNNVGTFQLEVRYTSEDYLVTDTTSSNFGKPINAGATSPPFTL